MVIVVKIIEIIRTDIIVHVIILVDCVIIVKVQLVVPYVPIGNKMN